MHMQQELFTYQECIPFPRLLFLATHTDMVPGEELPGVLDTLLKRLRNILLPKFKDQIIFCTKDGKGFIFTLNAAEPEQKYAEAV